MDGITRWRRVDLKAVIKARFGVDYHERHVGQILQDLGSRISARGPSTPAKILRPLRLLKNFGTNREEPLKDVPEGTPIEVGFQDEMRLAQKNTRVRLWARTGRRPRQPADQRYQSAYLFGAICPAGGTGAAIMMPTADTHAMQCHLSEISRRSQEVPMRLSS